MKIKHLTLTIGIGLIVGFIAYTLNHDKKINSYIPRSIQNQSETEISGAIKWYQRMRNNQETGSVDLKDIEIAQKQIKQLRLNNDKNLDLQWVEMGPDNIGGRTRAILVDNADSNLIFACGVSGGLWKSTLGGSSWEQVDYSVGNDEFTTLAVTSICQTINGDIYIGTGEGVTGSFHGENTLTPFIAGQGIWKSTDHGITWSKLTGTWTTAEQKDAFIAVNKLEAGSDNGTVYAATAKGIRVTTDGGTVWANPIENSNADYNQNATDIEVGSNGLIVASLNNKGYIKPPGGTWILVSDAAANDPDTLNSNKLPTDATRLEFDIAPSNPDYVYCGASHMWKDPVDNAMEDGLYNIYQSTDGGMTWEVIGPGGSPKFQPYGKQGAFDNLIKVDPGNETIVYVGGLDLWQWSDGTTWQQITGSEFQDWDPRYLHADQHDMVFLSGETSIAIIASDGGLTRLEQNIGSTSLNRNYNVTQFYSVAFDGDGRVLGGTQDNGTQYIDFNGNTEMASVRLLGGDGGQCAISQLNPDLIFATSQYGRLMRTNDYTTEFQFFYSDKILEDHLWTEPGLVDVGTDPIQGPFVTPIALWETHIDELSADSVELVCKRDYVIGEKVWSKSQNIYNLSLYKILEKNYYAENENNNDLPDTIKFKDPYGSILAFGLARQLWITRMGTNFNEMPGRWGWWRMLPVGFLDYDEGGAYTANDEMVEHIAISNNGDHIFFSTSRNKLYRVSNVKLARTRNNADMQFFAPSAPIPITIDDKVIEVQQIHDFGSRTVTDIYCDPQGIEIVLITLGNYGNDDYVYYSTTAATTTATDGNFYSVQGDLPKMPVYSGIINYNNSTMAIVGTEYGVFSCENLFASEPSWSDENGGLQNVPTFMIRQQTWPNWRPHTNNHGHLFIGTHGRGIWKSETLAGPVYAEENEETFNSHEANANIYPNPVSHEATLRFNLTINSDVTISIHSLNGQLVLVEKLANLNSGDHYYNFDASNLKAGSYIINVVSSKHRTFSKFIKY